MARESVLVATLVELADNLVDSYDVIDVLTMLSVRCVEVVDVDAVGVLLAAPGGELQLLASSNESMRILELFQIQANEGPCVDAYRTGQPIINHALSAPDERWPRFTPRAIELGYLAVHSLPMRLRGKTIGALNLFRSRPGWLEAGDVVLAQGLADVATIALIQHQAAVSAKQLNDQLSFALNGRIIIEQAKGMVSQATDSDMNDAFARLRAHARNRNIGLTEVAKRVIDGTIDPAELDIPAAPKSS